MKCPTVTGEFKISEGVIDDYERLSRYHYRGDSLGAIARVYILKGARAGVAGVLVYTMPMAGCQLRNVALGGVFDGLDRVSRLKLINKNIRRIARVIIEPRFRGLGLATHLVRETMAMMDVPIVESLAVMGHINPFFAKAGMAEYKAKAPTRCVQMTEALSTVGIEQRQFIAPRKVQRMLDKLDADRAEFIERQMKDFLLCYGRRKNMSRGIDRTRFILSRLTERPVYYVWFRESGKGTGAK